MIELEYYTTALGTEEKLVILVSKMTISSARVIYDITYHIKYIIWDLQIKMGGAAVYA